MSEKIVDEFIVPATDGRAFVIKKGQILSIIQVEGPQMADVTFLNANDFKEVFHAGWSAALNMLAGEGTLRRLKKLYSKPPRDHIMLTVVDDPVGVHLAWNGGRCSRKTMDILVAISACPFDLLYTPHSLQIRITEPEA